jgi:ribonuclease P protein component
MLKKAYRLSSVRLNNFNKIASDSFDIKIAKNNMEISRFGFVISKKIDKRAVIRNLIKRKLSRCIEEIFDRIETGSDFVFYPKLNAINIDQKSLAKELESVFKKERIIND